MVCVMQDGGGEGRGREGLAQVIVSPYRSMYSGDVLTMYEVLPVYFAGAEHGDRLRTDKE